MQYTAFDIKFSIPDRFLMKLVHCDFDMKYSILGLGK